MIDIQVDDVPGFCFMIIVLVGALAIAVRALKGEPK